MDSANHTTNLGSHGNRDSSVDPSVFIYAAATLAFMTAIFYLGRILFARYQYRRQARAERSATTKDNDYESGPPMYLHHFQDMEIIDARHASARHQSLSSPTSSQQTVVPVMTPASALIRGEGYYIVTPRVHSRTHSRSRSLSHSGLGSVASGQSHRHRRHQSHAHPSPLSTVIVIDHPTEGRLPPPPAYEDLSHCDSLLPRTDSSSAATIVAATAAAAAPSTVTTSTIRTAVETESNSSAAFMSSFSSPGSDSVQDAQVQIQIQVPERPSSTSTSYFSNAIIVISDDPVTASEPRV